MKNIIETAISNPEFSTLVTAIKAAGLVENLSAVGPFTVFAPTNKAFAKIPMSTLDSLLADKTKLTSILTYHVVAGKVMLQDAEKITEAKTLEGSEIKISIESEVMITEEVTPDVSVVELDSHSDILINNAHITIPDIECSNGVIHAIDTVLMP